MIDYCRLHIYFFQHYFYRLVFFLRLPLNDNIMEIIYHSQYLDSQPSLIIPIVFHVHEVLLFLSQLLNYSIIKSLTTFSLPKPFIHLLGQALNEDLRDSPDPRCDTNPFGSKRWERSKGELEDGSGGKEPIERI